MRTPGAPLPVSFAAACLAGAVFVPAGPAGAARALGAAPVQGPSGGTLSVCQAMTNNLDTGSAWSFAVRPKGQKKVAAGWLVPNGTKQYPACRTILLPPGAYVVTESPRKKQPLVRGVVKNQNGATKTYRPKNGEALRSAPLRVTESATTTVTFYNKQT